MHINFHSHDLVEATVDPVNGDSKSGYYWVTLIIRGTEAAFFVKNYEKAQKLREAFEAIAQKDEK